MREGLTGYIRPRQQGVGVCRAAASPGARQAVYVASQFVPAGSMAPLRQSATCRPDLPCDRAGRRGQLPIAVAELVLLTAILRLLASCGSGQGGGPYDAPLLNGAPVVTTSLGSEATVNTESLLVFSVKVVDPDGDAVSLNLLNPPPGCVFTPIVAAPSPATAVVRWRVPRVAGGHRTLCFRAQDHAPSPLVGEFRLTVRVQTDPANTPMLTGDVTGDGLLDVVAVAWRADKAIPYPFEDRVPDRGAIYVWEAWPDHSFRRLAVLGERERVAAGDALGYACVAAATGQGVQLADVTGDGILDVVAGASLADGVGLADTGAVYVWAGGAHLHDDNDATYPFSRPRPTAVLAVPGARAGDRLGDAYGQSVVFYDVTGDGILDVIVGAFLADVAGTSDAGAAYVWAGGPALHGAPAPHSNLTVPGAAVGDRLGDTSGQGIQVADVSGDGFADIILGARRADVDGVVDAGAIYVWLGGPAYAGDRAPSATLTVTGARAGDMLGDAYGQAIQLADVTADGILDILGIATPADFGGVADTGAAYLWAGGAGLSGPMAPTATLYVAGAAAGDHLGLVPVQSFDTIDVSGDGRLDIVGGAMYADVGSAVDAGAVYVWLGGPGLQGAIAPTTVLAVGVAGALLGYTAGQGVQFADVTGDGTMDVVAIGSRTALSVTLPDAGAIYVWEGGPKLEVAGSPLPRATLTLPAASAGDLLGVASGHGTLLADVTGDGTADVVTGAMYADRKGLADVGLVAVWEGGEGLRVQPAPRAVLSEAAPVAGDRLGYAPLQGIQVGDVSGDGILDIVVGAALADVGGVRDAGAAYVWRGGAGLQPIPGRLAARGTPSDLGAGQEDDRLGMGAGEGMECSLACQLGDLTGDGVLDVVLSSHVADEAGLDPITSAPYVKVDTGAIFVFDCRPYLAAEVPHCAALRPWPRYPPGGTGDDSKDQMGRASGQAVQLVDWSGDGVLDILVCTSRADQAAGADVGAIYLWRGAEGIDEDSEDADGGQLDRVPPRSVLQVFGSPDDRLGE